MAVLCARTDWMMTTARAPIISRVSPRAESAAIMVPRKDPRLKKVLQVRQKPNKWHRCTATRVWDQRGRGRQPAHWHLVAHYHHHKAATAQGEVLVMALMQAAQATVALAVLAKLAPALTAIARK